jgi:hypothetical protein
VSPVRYGLGTDAHCEEIQSALCSSETSVLTRATRHNIPEDAILHSHRRGNLISYGVCEPFGSVTVSGKPEVL